MTIPYIATGIFTPICGFITDKYGKRMYFLFFACSLLMFDFAYMFLSPRNTSSDDLTLI